MLTKLRRLLGLPQAVDILYSNQKNQTYSHELLLARVKELESKLTGNHHDMDVHRRLDIHHANIKELADGINRQSAALKAFAARFPEGGFDGE